MGDQAVDHAGAEDVPAGATSTAALIRAGP
jgi:hypothetical protein